MKKTIAIPLEKDVLSAHFGHCQHFAIAETKGNKITNIQKHLPPEHTPGLYPIWLLQYGVTDIIAGGIGQKAINLFNQNNINVFVGAPIKSAEDIIIDFLNNDLELSANYCKPGNKKDHENCTG